MGGHCLCLPAKHRDTAAHIQYFTAELKTRINSMDKSAVQCVSSQSGLYMYENLSLSVKKTPFSNDLFHKQTSSRQSEFQEALMKYTFQRPDMTEGHKCSEMNIKHTNKIIFYFNSDVVSICLTLHCSLF